MIDWLWGQLHESKDQCFSKPSKQAITAEPFLPHEAQVQIQVELPSTFEGHILLTSYWPIVLLRQPP